MTNLQILASFIMEKPNCDDTSSVTWDWIVVGAIVLVVLIAAGLIFGRVRSKK